MNFKRRLYVPIYVEKKNKEKNIFYLNIKNNVIKRIRKKDNTLIYGIVAATLLPVFLKELVTDINYCAISISYLLSFIIGMVYTYVNKKNENKMLEESERDDSFNVQENITDICYFLDDDIQRWQILKVISIVILLFGLYLLSTNRLDETWFIITNLDMCIIPESLLCSQNKLKKNLLHKLRLQIKNIKS